MAGKQDLMTVNWPTGFVIVLVVQESVWVTEFVVLDFDTGGNSSYVWCIKRSPPKVDNLFIIMAASEILLIKMGKIFMFLK